MLQTTRAVVLRATKHSDRSVVLRAYTERFGLRAYIVRASSKGGSPLAALQALSRIELVAPESGDHGLCTVREIRIDRAYTRLHQEPLRGVLLLFAQEVFDRTLREETADPQLFKFVEDALEMLDTSEDLLHQPVLMLVGLCKHLGFSPEPPASGEDRFDLREGYFFQGEPPHEWCMERDQALLFAQALDHMGSGGTALMSRAASRKRLLDDLLLYYRLHVDGFGELRSLDVLRSVLA